MKTRFYENADIESLINLWADVFGDSQTFIKDFFRLLPQTGNCVVGVEDEKIVAMASILTDLKLIEENKATNVGYIYAVAVDPSCRGKGYGIEISKAAYDAALKMGAEIVTTMPSSDSLYSFYANALGMKTALYRNAFNVMAEDIEKVRKADANEYLNRRNALLESKSHLSLGYKTAELYQILCEEYGGGLYIAESGICSAQVSDDVCIIYEMISNNPEKLAKSVAYKLGVKSAQYYLPSAKGTKFIMEDANSDIPNHAVYNVAFE